MSEESATPEIAAKPETPAPIIFGLYAMLVGAASPVLSEVHNFLAGNHGKNGLGVFLGWMVLGAVAAVIGIVSTIIGLTMPPRTRLTHIAVMVALVEIVLVLYFLVLA